MHLQQLPTQPVQDEQHHRVRVSGRARKPCIVHPPDERRNDLFERRRAVVRSNRFFVCHGGTVERRSPWRPLGRLVCEHGEVKVSTRGDYAARALLSLALHGIERPTSVKEIAERTNLPQPYLEQILLAVKGAGLVRSKRGVGGGYVLARPPQEISLAEILAAVDGPLTRLPDVHDHCEGHCVLQEVWVGVSEAMGRLLQGHTLADLAHRVRVGHPNAALDTG